MRCFRSMQEKKDVSEFFHFDSCGQSTVKTKTFLSISHKHCPELVIEFPSAVERNMNEREPRRKRRLVLGRGNARYLARYRRWINYLPRWILTSCRWSLIKSRRSLFGDTVTSPDDSSLSRVFFHSQQWSSYLSNSLSSLNYLLFFCLQANTTTQNLFHMQKKIQHRRFFNSLLRAEWIL